MAELYTLPDGWEWKKLTEVVQIGCNKGFTPSVFEGKVPFIGMSDIDENKGRETKYILEDFEKVSKGKTKFQKNAVLVGKITPCTQNNKTTIVPTEIDGGFATTEVYALHSMDRMNPFYLNYFIRSNKINKYLVESMIGATGRQRVPSDTIKNLDIPLPPFSEQQRIVSKLDNLFEKIDKAISLHQKNMDEVDVFMGSVLNDVFGELGEKYPKSMINEISTVKGGKRVPKGYKLSEEETPYPYLRVTDFTNNGTISTEKMLYLSEDIYQQIKRYTITDEDLYITNVGNTIGKSGIIPSELNGANLTENAVKLVYKDKKNTSNKYMYYFTKSSVFISQMENATKQMAVPKLAIMRLGEITTPFPPLHIQQKVVKYLDEVSQKIEKVKSIQKEKMDSLKALKASILDKAFRGEL